jgi:hypothetical protein
MVRSTGPLASLHAAGALGGVLTFRRSPRGTSIVHTSKPHDPKSPAQLGARALMRLLQTMWPLLTSAFKADWKASADSSNQDAYLAFLSYNLRQFRNFLAPLGDKPRSTTPLTWNTVTQSITAEVHALRLFHDTSGITPLGCYLIYRRLGGIPDQNQNELVGGTYATTTAELNFLDVVPTLDAYGYRVTRYTVAGIASPSTACAATAPLDA